jgi:hypothetical protein
MNDFEARWPKPARAEALGYRNCIPGVRARRNVKQLIGAARRAMTDDQHLALVPFWGDEAAIKLELIRGRDPASVIEVLASVGWIRRI